jgi:hypothetical protein
MAIIVVILIILGCAVFQYLKGTIVQAFATIVVAISSCMAAFGFFENLAGLLIKRGDSGSMLALVPWAHSLSFLLIFIIVFAVLQTIVVQLTRKYPVDLGFLPERIGRVVLGIVLGVIVSGILMTFLAMAPLPYKYPYERFNPRSIKVDSPNKVFLNVDGFVTGLFSVVSNGSFSSQKSFACLRPSFLDQLYLNRLDSNVSLVSGITPAIEVPRDKAVWPASENLKTQVDELNSQGKFSRTPGKPTGNYQLMVVRVGIKRGAVINSKPKINAGTFTLSQLRLICKPRDYDGGLLEGKGRNVYPLGYLKTASQIETDSVIKIERNDFTGNSTTKDLDFIFAVPFGLQPVLVEFKLNNVMQIPTSAILKDAADAPPPAVLEQSSESDSRDQGTDTSVNQQDSAEESDQEQSPPQESSGGTPEQSRVERLTESITGVQLDEDQ